MNCEQYNATWEKAAAVAPDVSRYALKTVYP